MTKAEYKVKTLKKNAQHSLGIQGEKSPTLKES